MTTIGEVVTALETAYPVRLAESWDTGIGLTCGDQSATVTTVLLAVDVDDVTVAEAIELGADLLVTHHPLLFRAVQSVAADSPRGSLVHKLIRAGVAHFAAHTNADRAVGGVNDALAQALGLTDTRALDPAASDNPLEGLGRIGILPESLALSDFAELVARALPAVVGGVRVADTAGRGPRTIRTVAVCGGSGSSLLKAAADNDADVFVTSELSHHVAGEFVAVPGRPALVEIAHFAGEWPWLQSAAGVIEEAFPGSVACTVSTLRTDPWILHRSSVDAGI